MGSLCRVLTRQTSLAIKLRGLLELVIELALGAFAWKGVIVRMNQRK